MGGALTLSCLLLRRIRTSMSLSRKWFNELAPPDAKAPAPRTTAIRVRLGGPPEARNVLARAVKRRRRTIRGLLRLR